MFLHVLTFDKDIASLWPHRARYTTLMYLYEIRDVCVCLRGVTPARQRITGFDRLFLFFSSSTAVLPPSPPSLNHPSVSPNSPPLHSLAPPSRALKAEANTWKDCWPLNENVTIPVVEGGRFALHLRDYHRHDSWVFTCLVFFDCSGSFPLLLSDFQTGASFACQHFYFIFIFIFHIPPLSL